MHKTLRPFVFTITVLTTCLRLLHRTLAQNAGSQAEGSRQRRLRAGRRIRQPGRSAPASSTSPGPRTATGRSRRLLCIHGGGFRAGRRRGYDALVLPLAEHGYVAVTVSYRLAPKYPIPGGDSRRQGGGPLAAGQRREVPHRPRAHRRHRRLGGRAPRPVPRRDRRTSRNSKATAAIPTSRAGSPASSTIYGPSDFTKSYGKSVDAAEVLPLVARRRSGEGPAQAHRRQPALLGDAATPRRRCASTAPRTSTSPTNRPSG